MVTPSSPIRSASEPPITSEGLPLDCETLPAALKVGAAAASQPRPSAEILHDLAWTAKCTNRPLFSFELAPGIRTLEESRETAPINRFSLDVSQYFSIVGKNRPKIYDSGEGLGLKKTSDGAHILSIVNMTLAGSADEEKSNATANAFMRTMPELSHGLHEAQFGNIYIWLRPGGCTAYSPKREVRTADYPDAFNRFLSELGAGKRDLSRTQSGFPLAQPKAKTSTGITEVVAIAPGPYGSHSGSSQAGSPKQGEWGFGKWDEIRYQEFHLLDLDYGQFASQQTVCVRGYESDRATIAGKPFQQSTDPLVQVPIDIPTLKAQGAVLLAVDPDDVNSVRTFYGPVDSPALEEQRRLSPFTVTLAYSESVSLPDAPPKPVGE